MPLQRFHEALLPSTLQNAAKTAFYRTAWQHIDWRAASVGDLTDFPIVTKADVRDAGRDAQVRDDDVCEEVFTSGTTGHPLITVRGAREQQFIRDFYSGLIEDEHESVARRRGIQLANPYHGHHVAIPSLVHFHTLSVYDSGSFAHAIDVLTGRCHDPGVEDACTLMVGLERSLRALTANVALTAEDSGRLALQAVVSYSQYLTTAWRARLESTWRAPVIDRYSLAEMFGGAASCLKCGWWHFDPFVVPHVVGARSAEPVLEGLGILVLTTLYPFQQAQPMVRYWTGDLVETTVTSSCRPGETAIKPRGRAAFGVARPDGDEWLLAPVIALEALDESDAVSRLPRFRDSAQVADPYAIGHPRYHIEHSYRSSHTHIVIHVEPKGPITGATAYRLRESIRTDIYSAAPVLAEAIERGDADLEVLLADVLTPDLLSHSE